MTLDKIQQNFPTTVLRGNGTTNITDKIKICYENGARLFNRSLFHLIEGTMMLDGQMFTRIDRAWYFMTDELIRSTHIEFRKFLRDHLTTKRSNGQILEKLWTPGVNEGDYNKLYVDPYFLVGDDCTYGSVELFDLMRYDPLTGQIILYYVKKHLEGNTRLLAHQIMGAKRLIEGCFTGQEATSNLRRYYESIVQRYIENGAQLSEHYDSFEKFVDLLSRKNMMTIIVAIYDQYNGNYTLQNESVATDEFNVKDIEKAYRKLSSYDREYFHQFYDSSYSLFEWLISKGYVKASYRNPKYGYSTSKLFLSHRRSDLITHPNYFRHCDEHDDRLDRIIWFNIVKPFSSNFKSTSAKFCLMDMYEQGNLSN